MDALTLLLYAGILIALIGLVGLFRCIIVARRLRGLGAEEARERLQGLVALNLGSVSLGFLGLALVAVALILG